MAWNCAIKLENSICKNVSDGLKYKEIGCIMLKHYHNYFLNSIKETAMPQKLCSYKSLLCIFCASNHDHACWHDSQC